jgi:hypothetical protein
MRIIISSDYYDNRTRDMLLKEITTEENNYIKSINETIEDFLYKRWNKIVHSLPNNYYNQYASQETPQERNNWFQRYLDYPTKDITLMPEIL